MGDLTIYAYLDISCTAPLLAFADHPGPQFKHMHETTPILRHWKILHALCARRLGTTVRELSQEMGVSEKTISRDLASLRDIGFPLQESVGEQNRKFWKIENPNGIPPLAFTLEEAAALYLGRQFLEPLAGTLFHQGAKSAFDKIRSFFGDAALRHVTKLAHAFYHKTHGFADYSSKAEIVDRLQQAIEDCKITVISYQSLRSTEPVTYFDLHPHAMVVHKNALYLLVWSSEKNEFRTFKVDRIASVDLQHLAFTPQKSFDLERCYQHSFGIFQKSGPPTTVRVRFHPQVQRLMEEKAYHESQQTTRDDKGYTIATFKLSSFEEFQSWLLSFGPYAEVLEPMSLRQAVAESLKGSLMLYGSDLKKHRHRKAASEISQKINRVRATGHARPK